MNRAWSLNAPVGKTVRVGFFAVAFSLASAAAAHATLTISTRPTKFVTCSGGVCFPTKSNAILNVNDLQNLLSGSGITVTTTSASAQANDIVVGAVLTWASASMLTLDAFHSITVNQPASDTGSGGLTIHTNDGGSGGRFSFGNRGSVQIWSAGDSLIVNDAPYTLAFTVAELARLIADNPGGNFALARPYDASVDGTYAHAPIPTAFTGTFEGLGNKLSHLSVRDTVGGEPVGLFGLVSTGGTLRDTVMFAADVIGTGTVGGFAAINTGTISQEIIEGGLVKSTANDNTGQTGPHVVVGGLVGENDGTISYSRSTSSVTGNVGDSKSLGATVIAGGLVGLNNGLAATIASSWAGGAVNATITAPKTDVAHGDVGGLVGKNVEGSIINNSFAVGASSFSGQGGDNIGGLVGTNDNGTITTASASGSATGGDYGSAGGLIGVNENVISCGCGLVDATVATGAAQGSTSGGLMGYSNQITVTNSTSSGAVHFGAFSNHSNGGFVGYDASPQPSSYFNNDGWNMTKSGITNPHDGAGNVVDDPGITGF